MKTVVCLFAFLAMPPLLVYAGCESGGCGGTAVGVQSTAGAQALSLGQGGSVSITSGPNIPGFVFPGSGAGFTPGFIPPGAGATQNAQIIGEAFIRACGASSAFQVVNFEQEGVAIELLVTVYGDAGLGAPSSEFRSQRGMLILRNTLPENYGWRCGGSIIALAKKDGKAHLVSGQLLKSVISQQAGRFFLGYGYPEVAVLTNESADSFSNMVESDAEGSGVTGGVSGAISGIVPIGLTGNGNWSNGRTAFVSRTGTTAWIFLRTTWRNNGRPGIALAMNERIRWAENALATMRNNQVGAAPASDTVRKAAATQQPQR